MTLDADRERDRSLRAAIDPLIGELTPIGKIELAMRLMGESMIEGLRQTTQRRTITPTIVRVIEAPKETGESARAPGKDGSPAKDGTRPEQA